ncbi:MAG: glycosyltransferase family 4 protein [Candidatus Omnitrophota bacterium]
MSSKLKKILFISTIPLSLKAFSLPFMVFLRNKGFKVEAASGAGQEVQDIEKAGFRFHEINIPRGINPINDFRAYRCYKKLLTGADFDLVHTQTSKAGFIARKAAFDAGVPVIVHNVGGWPFHPFLPALLRYFYLTLEKKAAHWADALILVSKAEMEYGLRFKAAPAGKMYQIYNGIDLQRFFPYEASRKRDLRAKYGIASEKIVVGCIARLVEDKGIETFLAAAKELKNDNRFIFILGGEGHLRGNFERFVFDNKMKGKVIFAGYLNDTASYLNMFDLFCLPTRREGFGAIFAEAQACGVPVIASDIPSLREVILDGVSGKLLPPDDVSGFANAMRFFNDGQIRQKFAEAGRRHVEDKFALTNIHEQLFALYSMLWAKSQSGGLKR